MQHEFDKSLIINMDETPMCFDMPSSTTIDVRGKKEILVRGTGAHKRRFTITLSCTASGAMLTPFVTFKAKTDRTLKKMTYNARDIVVTNQPKGWMDSKLMQVWIQKVLVKYTKGRHALLIFDTFKGPHRRSAPQATDEQHHCGYDPGRLHQQNSTTGCLFEQTI